MNTSDNDFPLAVGDLVRVISKQSLRYGQDGVVKEVPPRNSDSNIYLVQLISEPLSNVYPHNPGYYARHALCFLAPFGI